MKVDKNKLENGNFSDELRLNILQSYVVYSAPKRSILWRIFNAIKENIKKTRK